MNPGSPALLDVKARLIVALDFPDAVAALDLVDRLEETCNWFKVGLELYYAAGNSLIERLKGKGFNVFLDLKLHDIPNTVAAAVRSVTHVGAALLTVHAAGGEAMMQAAAEAAAMPGAPELLAVTVLTSMSREQLAGVGVMDPPIEQVLRLGLLAKRAGILGLVCSPQEVKGLRAELGPDAILVTPGIRGQEDAMGDQKRVASAAEAIAWGASRLVVGRPITKAADPARAVSSLLEEMARAERLAGIR